MWELVLSHGSSGGRGPSNAPARISPNYLTLSVETWKAIGEPRFVSVEVDARQRALRVTPMNEFVPGAFHVTDNHHKKSEGRKRISVGTAITRGGFVDIRKGGETVDCTINPDLSAVFKLR